MSEVALFPLWVTMFLTIWAPVGPLLGILVGHLLVRSWERKRWLADNRKEEYRRVLAGLNRLNMVLIDLHCYGTANLEDMKQALNESTVALNTTLFINEFLEESKVAGLILDATTTLNSGGSFDDYREKYWKAINLIMASAKKSGL